jgi:hypothetical protein
VFEAIKADRLAKVVIDWLPPIIKAMPISTYATNSNNDPVSKKWAIKNNSRSFDLRQVEQNLLLCRAMNALFNDDFLKNQIAMRDGQCWCCTARDYLSTVRWLFG